MGTPCSPGVYIGAAGLALAGIALIAYFAGRDRSRTKVLLLGGAGLLSAVLIVIGVELKLREEHEVVKSTTGTEVVCHHGEAQGLQPEVVRMSPTALAAPRLGAAGQGPFESSHEADAVR